MGHIEKGTLQIPVRIGLTAPDPRAHAEYAVAVLRILARKDVGEPLTEEEREAVRLALRGLGRAW